MAKACPQSEQLTPVFVRHTKRIKCVHHIQYKYPGPLKRKGYVGESVPQLTVSMGDQERVSASIGLKAFLYKLILLLTHYGGRCGSVLSK
jgi:hypothetical protein